jgi:hypothetical protein
MQKILVSAVIIAASSLALAKLPPPDDAAKAKAAEASAKAAWQSKVGAYQQCKVEDKLAAQHKSTAGKANAASAPPQAAASAPPQAAASSGTAPAGTPVASKPPTPCADPGPFAYSAPEQMPLETSGAHSPAANANTPPSVRAESATMAPVKK